MRVSRSAADMPGFYAFEQGRHAFRPGNLSKFFFLA
jgi:hypothetical protein